MKIIPVTKFRTKALSAVRQTQQMGEEFLITNKGKAAAVLMSYEDWEGLVETLEIKKDKKLMREIKTSQRYFSGGGKGVSLADIKWD